VSDERARRVGINEGVFRAVNERLEELADQAGLSERHPLDLVCECGSIECAQRIEMTRDAYEALRQDPVRFAVVPGHELPDVEEVIARSGGYFVVQKRAGEAAKFARQTDPRGD
jgi:hypothetical protein